ncbi:scavenger mRNA decapping enzyme [Leptospira inadai serovar Lyme str. 10]|uniref:Scavenger mRNA decapping enzyme n=2 Tax=Leptospira inadai serovar Lyme TaxID=293084 RepID=V6HFK3_9LEPT|nr:histidine triad nucleotide-binding protein [Leptospira inadai]EQA38498.1 scavenger mRNA decapping enzyme [Leptospira inadai serovar Lyme str. 10]PNV74231.1 histidine triad nucleotide-binding protein [Leptospira inadai serovar Lyme]
MNEPNCLFCKIIRKEIPAKIAYEDEEILAFHDVSPQAPVHVLVIPKKHFVSLDEIGSEEKKLAGEILFRIREVARSLGLEKDGYRVVNNKGPLGGQTVFHLHFHLLGGRHMTWPPG